MSSFGPFKRREQIPGTQRALVPLGDATSLFPEKVSSTLSQGVVGGKSKIEAEVSRYINSAAKIIDLALYGGNYAGGRSDFPARSLIGVASYPSVKAFWEEALGRPIGDVIEDYKKTVPFPEEVNVHYMAEAFEQHTAIYLTAAIKDPKLLERAIRLLPKYTNFVGATADPEELKRIKGPQEVARLDKILSHGRTPKPGTLQVILVDTVSYGTLEITRYKRTGEGESHFYSVGKDGAQYGISTDGLSDLRGILPDVAVVDPKALRFPLYSELTRAIEIEGRNFRFDHLNEQHATLVEYPPSGPAGFRYCSYEAQQSLESDLPGRDQSRIDVVSSSWSSQLRLQIYGEAARSPDVSIRVFGTRLVGLYREAIPLLREAVHDSSPEVAHTAREALARFKI